MTRKSLLIALMLFLTTSIFAGANLQASQLTEYEAYMLGFQAYVYAYPLVLTELTKLQLIKLGIPSNQFYHAQAFTTPELKIVVRPNVDTLYSVAWLDLSRAPVILSVPDTDRYYLVQLLDAWTENFAVPGTRTTGTKAGNFAITGPNWQGTLPEGAQEIKAPTNSVLVSGRIQTNGVNDIENVCQIQRGFKLTPLSEWGKHETSQLPKPRNDSVEIHTPLLQQVEQMDMQTFFETFAQSLKSNPPHDADALLLGQLEAIGIIAGKDFDASSLEPDTIKGLERAVIAASRQIMMHVGFGRNSTMKNGWGFLKKVGRYGTNYLDRAGVALVGFGALSPEDAVYGGANFDSDKRTLNGASRYVIHFDKNALPPVRGFWSVTLYGPDGFFAENSINRYAIGDRHNLSHNPDGSLDIYIQYDRPETKKVSNWLPAPDGRFSLTMRLYWPKPEVTNGSWEPPSVNCVH